MVFFHYSLDISLHQCTHFTRLSFVFSPWFVDHAKLVHADNHHVSHSLSSGDYLYRRTSHQQTPNSKKWRVTVKSHSVNSFKPHNWQAALCDKLAYEQVIYVTFAGKGSVSVMPWVGLPTSAEENRLLHY